MRKLWLMVAIAGWLVAWNPVCAAEWDFEDAQLGQLPSGWSAAKTGEGPGSQWKVIEDSTAPAGPKVLAQVSSDGPRRLFNLCIADDSEWKNVDLSVAVKAVKGQIDQGGGPIWRCQDQDNYYVARLNPLESNYRVYKVAGGKRTQLGSFDLPSNAASLTGKWFVLRIVHYGNAIRCYLDGKPVMDVKDQAIQQSGRVGLWTKADAVSCFDKLSVKGSQ